MRQKKGEKMHQAKIIEFKEKIWSSQEFIAEAKRPESTLLSRRGSFLLGIDPNVCSYVLENNNGKNRENDLHKTSDRYAQYMRDGRWYPELCPITFAEDGHLISGQNRLEAIRKANAYFVYRIITGLPVECRQFDDTGRNKTPRDRIKIIMRESDRKEEAETLAKNIFISTVGIGLQVQHGPGARNSKKHDPKVVVEMLLRHKKSLLFSGEVLGDKTKSTTKEARWLFCSVYDELCKKEKNSAQVEIERAMRSLVSSQSWTKAVAKVKGNLTLKNGQIFKSQAKILLNFATGFLLEEKP